MGPGNPAAPLLHLRNFTNADAARAKPPSRSAPTPCPQLHPLPFSSRERACRLRPSCSPFPHPHRPRRFASGPRSPDDLRKRSSRRPPPQRQDEGRRAARQPGPGMARVRHSGADGPAGADRDEGVEPVRQRSAGHLPAQRPGTRPRGVPGRRRRARAVRHHRGHRAGRGGLRGRRPGGGLPHRRLRGVRGVPPGLHDLVQRPGSAAGLRLAARRRARTLPAGRRGPSGEVAGRAELRGRSPGGLRLRHRLLGLPARRRLGL